MPRLTTKSVETAKPAAARQELPDGLLKGLYLVVQPSGAKSWAVRYRHNGRPAKHTLGSYPALDLKTARELGAKALRAAAEGRDPAGEKRQEKATIVKDVVAQFLARQDYRPRTRYENERLLNRHVVARWGSRPIGGISRADIRDMLDELAEDAPVLANRLHAVMRRLFRWARDAEIVTASPFADLKRPAKEASRERILDDRELRAVWHAAEQLGPFGKLAQLLALTGCRRSELANLTWDEIDLEHKVIRLPRERVKNNRSHDVPLSPQAVAVIKTLPRRSERYVFSFGDGPIGNFKAKKRLDKLSGVSDWVLHDLRRTVASGMARLNVNLPVIEKVLNHQSGSFAGIVGVYQRHSFDAEKRDALNRWGAHVAAVTDQSGKVVALQGRKT